MKKRYLLFLSFLFLLANSCKKNVSNEMLIAGNSYKYWLEVDESRKGSSKVIYYFDNRGKWLVFLKYANGEFSKYKMDDIVLIERWRFINDTLIDIGTAQYPIVSLNDSVFIYKSQYEGIKKLVKAPEKLIPLECQKLQ